MMPRSQIKAYNNNNVIMILRRLETPKSIYEIAKENKLSYSYSFELIKRLESLLFIECENKKYIITDRGKNFYELALHYQASKLIILESEIELNKLVIT